MAQTRNKYMQGVYPLDEDKGLIKGRGIFTGQFVDNVYQPSLIYRLLKPKKISGNDVNGLGETTPRLAGKAFHWFLTDWRKFPYLLVNAWFMLRSMIYKHSTQSGFKEGIEENVYWRNKTKVLNKKKPLLKPTVVQRSKEEWATLIKEKAMEFGANSVGITQVTDEMLYEGRGTPGKYLVIVSTPMDYEKSKTLPEAKASAETMVAYAESNKVGYKLVEWLHTQGVAATGSDIMPDKIILPIAAYRAGLGQLGKHGSLISPLSGALTRFNYVAFDLDVDLPLDQPIDFGVDEFCAHCQVCSVNCPGQAILPTKQMVRGVEKWYVDFEKCTPYFVDNNGCGRCLAVCPWSIETTSNNFLQKMLKQKEKLAELKVTDS